MEKNKSLKNTHLGQNKNAFHWKSFAMNGVFLAYVTELQTTFLIKRMRIKNKQREAFYVYDISYR